MKAGSLQDRRMPKALLDKIQKDYFTILCL
jgi:hypothetical protein